MRSLTTFVRPQASSRTMTRLGARGTALLAAFAATGCSSDRLEVPNYNSPTPGDAASAPLVALAQSSAGIFTQMRGLGAGPIQQFAILGREAFNYTPQEGRNTTGYLQNPTDNT